MKGTSKTGLASSPTKKINRFTKIATVQLRAIAQPAPFVLKPFAGLYNPYPYGCSLLCNHPNAIGAKELLKKAKNNWGFEGKNILLKDEIDAIREGLEKIKRNDNHCLTPLNHLPTVESVPEELFRRYTDTDSRPLTPAPTLASGATRASGSRRCVTPDPLPTNQIREKTLLILDLRRSHSQETLSYYGSSSLQEPPLIRIHHISGSSEEINTKLEIHSRNKNTLSTISSPKRVKSASNDQALPEIDENIPGDDTSQLDDKSDAEDEEDFVKRRGKRKRKKGRDASRGPPAFQVSLDPETQVATLGAESHNPSARPSLVPATDSQDIPDAVETKKPVLKPSKSLDIDSFLDVEILKQLRRELNEEIVDNELDLKRRMALEEALKTVSKDKRACDELVTLQKQLQLPKINAKLWLSLPRSFTRSSARFELPMDSRRLSKMTPLDYVRDHISITKPRKLLYNCIFNKFKMDFDIENEHQRTISGSRLVEALGVMMGKPLSLSQSEHFRNLIGWQECDIFDFKTFCGICALCERLLAVEYWPQLSDRTVDPCHKIETADFEVLERKLNGKNADSRLVTILNDIKRL